jgi:hypothetical protein
VIASDVLRQAAEVIEQRGALRDKPDGERSMERAVAAYTALNGSKMDGELDGWLFLIVLKMARATAGKPHFDDLQDLVGYGALAAECLSKEAEAEEDFEAFRKAFNESIDRSEKMDDGWIKWGGGENPVPNKKVIVKHRNGEISGCEDYFRCIWSGEREWEWAHGDYDIVAYKVVNTEQRS